MNISNRHYSAVFHTQPAYPDQDTPTGETPSIRGISTQPLDPSDAAAAAPQQGPRGNDTLEPENRNPIPLERQICCCPIEST